MISNDTNAVLTGGTATAGTNMTLNNSGVSFAQNGTTNIPVRVTGVANGTQQYDAVNFGQLQALERLLSKGIASSTAVANLPQVDPGKTFSVGVALGSYNGYSAIAFGMHYRFSPNGQMKASLGTAGSKSTFGIGAGWSW